jgi:hypothetical protein
MRKAVFWQILWGEHYSLSKKEWQESAFFGQIQI